MPVFEQALSLIRFLEVGGEFTGSGVRVVFIDSGCGKDLPVKDCINLTESSDIDTEGHGSAVHRILAAMLPDAEIYMVKVPDPLPDNVLITALNEAHKLMPHAVNLSITSEIPSDGSDPVSFYVNHVASRSAVVVAAGNGGPRMMSVGSPAVAAGALTVGATDLRGRLWSRSSRGPTLDGRWKPNIVAPTGYRPPNSSKELYGTSFSTPLATAVAACLMKQVNDPSTVVRILELTATSINLAQPSTPLLTGLRKAELVKKLLTTWPRIFDPRNLAGMGLLNAAAAHRLTRQMRKAFSTI